MKTLTRKQLGYIVSNHDYIALRWIDGDVVGINCKMSQIGKRKYPSDNVRTNAVSFYPISFHEYIRIKRGIL